MFINCCASELMNNSWKFVLKNIIAEQSYDNSKILQFVIKKEHPICNI